MVSDIKPLVIPVFIPHSGCPHQCAFCNQSIITNQKTPLPDKRAIQDAVKLYLQYQGQRRHIELAFFGGNFLGLSHENVLRLLNWVQPYVNEKKIDGIRFSTRPDTITKASLDLLRPFSISTIELGVQSMNDTVLGISRRGHTRMDTIEAVTLLNKYPYKIGAQVMLGLPGEDEVSLLDSTKETAALGPDFARIYPLMVLKDSLLEHWYKKGKYQALTLEESVQLVKKMYLIFKAANVDVIRMGLQASDSLEDGSTIIAGPWHPAFGHLVFAEILYDRVCKKIDAVCGQLASEDIILKVHPRSESRLRGDKNANLAKLKHRYPHRIFSIHLDENIPANDVDIELKHDHIL